MCYISIQFPQIHLNTLCACVCFFLKSYLQNLFANLGAAQWRAYKTIQSPLR